MNFSDVQLKPCPFCGGSAEFKQTGSHKLMVRCKSCHIGIQQKVLRYSLEWLRDTLTENWNRRVLSDLLETLEAVIRLKPLIDYPNNTKEKHIGEAMAISGMLRKVETAISKAKGQK